MIDKTFLLRARTHLSIAHHIPGRIRLRFKPSILSLLHGQELPDGEALLGGLEGLVRDLRINHTARSLVIEYDKNRISPQWWEKLIGGSDDEAQDVFAALEKLVATSDSPTMT